MTNKKQVEYLQYKFSDAEIRVLSQDAGRIDQEMKTLENRMDQIKKSLAGEIAEKKTELSKLMAKLAGGFEYRNVDCEIQLDTPKQGQASIVRLDTDEVIKVRRMTDEELQITLPLEESVDALPEAVPEPVVEEPVVEEPVVEAEVIQPCTILREYTHSKNGGSCALTVSTDEQGSIRMHWSGQVDGEMHESPDGSKVYETIAAAAKDGMIAIWNWAFAINGGTTNPVKRAASLAVVVYASDRVKELQAEAGE